MYEGELPGYARSANPTYARIALPLRVDSRLHGKDDSFCSSLKIQTQDSPRNQSDPTYDLDCFAFARNDGDLF